MRKFWILFISVLLIMALSLILIVVGILPFPSFIQIEGLQVTPLLAIKRQEIREHQAPTKPELIIANPRGDLVIRGGDVEEVQIKIRKATRTSNPHRTRQLLQQTVVKIETTNRTNKLTVDQPELAQGEIVETNLEIVVPVTTNLDIQTTGQVEIKDTRGTLRVLTKQGQIKVANFVGDANLETYLGNVEILNSRFVKELAVTVHQGDLSIAGALATWNMLENKSGHIELLFPPNEAYVLEGAVGLEQIDIQVPFEGQQTWERFRGVVGDGVQRGTIMINSTPISLRLKNQKDRSD